MAVAKPDMSRLILIAALTAIFAAIVGSYLDMSKDLAEAKDTAGQALRATVRIEERLAKMDAADAVTAADATDRLKAEVLELQQQQREASK